MTIRSDIYTEIDAERDRQDAKWGWIGTDSTMAGDSEYAKLAVLGEEYGEVAKALLEGDPQAHLEEELVQVAAVAVAWIEAAREKRADVGMHYIVAARYGQAEMVAQSLGDKHFQYVTSVQALTGVGAGATILKHETCRDRDDWYEMHHAIVWAEQRGARVIQVREGDVR